MYKKFIYLSFLVLSTMFCVQAGAADTAPTYNQEGDEAVMGEAKEVPDQPVTQTTLDKSVTPDQAPIEGAAQDEIVSEAVIEPPLQPVSSDENASPENAGQNIPVSGTLDSEKKW